MREFIAKLIEKIGKGPLAALFIMAMVIATTTASLAGTTGNLIANPSLETGTGNAATDWTKAKSGGMFNTVTFSMQSTGSKDGTRSAYIKQAGGAAGSAYWKPTAITTISGATYNYSSWYKSNVATTVKATVELTTGRTQSLILKSPAASSTAWQQVAVGFTAPANAKKITVYHVLAKHGWLQTDNYSLTATTADPIPTPTPTPTPSANMVTNNSIELGVSPAATDWTPGNWGTNTATFTTPVGSAQDGQRSARIDVSGYNSGDAKWMMKPVDVTPGNTYNFSNWYKSNTASQLDIAYTMQDGTTQYEWLKDLPAASSWTNNAATFTAPANAKNMIVFQLIAGNGWLETDNYSVTTPTAPAPTPTPSPSAPFSKPLVSIEFDDGWGSAYELGLPAVEQFGWKPTQYIITDTAANNANYGEGTYMTPAQIIDWNRRADIGSHSVTHASIPTLTAAQMRGELENSKLYLDGLLGENTNLYVSPYCESSQAVIDIVKTLYQSMRNCEATYNSASNFNRWDLKSFIVLNTTSDAEITTLLNQTKANNGWLIIVWHEIAGDNVNSWSVSQATLKRQLQLIKDSGIEVTTTQEALNRSLGQN